MSRNKLPDECSSLTEVRAEIDRIDHAIIGLIGERRDYVLAAARYKLSSEAVAAPERFAAMLKARREWAEAAGVNADVIENLYRDLVEHFIAEERAHWESTDKEQA